MKKINLLIIISLIFASITTLFWESIRDLILKFNISELIQILLIFVIHYSLDIFFMLVITMVIIIVVFRNSPEKKNNALNMLMKFIGSYLIVNALYWLSASIFLFLQVRQIIVLPPISFKHTILPFLAISFISNAENPSVLFGLPFFLSALVALFFYLIYRCLLSSEQRRIYLPRGFLFQLMLSSSIVGVLNTIIYNSFDDNSFLDFSLSIVYVVIFFVTGLLINSQKRSMKGK